MDYLMDQDNLIQWFKLKTTISSKILHLWQRVEIKMSLWLIAGWVQVKRSQMFIRELFIWGKVYWRLIVEWCQPVA